MRLFKHILVVISCYILFACASAQIVIEVDLYDEDPQVTLPPTPKDNADLLAQAQMLPMAASTDKNLSQQWKQKVLNIYQNLWYSAGGTRSSESVTSENIGQMIASHNQVAGTGFKQQQVRRSLDNQYGRISGSVESGG